MNDQSLEEKWKNDPAFVTTWKFSIPLLDEEEEQEQEEVEVEARKDEIVSKTNIVECCSRNDKDNNNKGNTLNTNTTATDTKIESVSSNSTGAATTTTTETTTSNSETRTLPTVPQHIIDSFRTNGFIVFTQSIVSKKACDELNIQLEELLRGRYNTGIPPDKFPKLMKSEYVGSLYDQQLQLQKQKQQKQQQQQQNTTTQSDTNSDDTCSGNVDDNNSKNVPSDKYRSTRKSSSSNRIPKSIVGPIGFSGNYNNVRVLQIINAQKANWLYNKLARCVNLGKVVADLTGWSDGVRLVQDQIWAKPPLAPPLAYHRDSPYFMFIPNNVITVWIALDCMDEQIGPLHYVRYSHLWGSQRSGTAQQFFQSHGGIDLLTSAASLQVDTNNNTTSTTSTTSTTTNYDDDNDGHDPTLTNDNDGNNQTTTSNSIESLIDIVSVAGIPAGAISIHDGKTWHGSTRNNSTVRPRRGIGLHYAPINVKFTWDAKYSLQWKHYLHNLSDDDDPSTVPLPIEDFPIPYQKPKTKTVTL